MEKEWLIKTLALVVVVLFISVSIASAEIQVNKNYLNNRLSSIFFTHKDTIEKLNKKTSYISTNSNRLTNFDIKYQPFEKSNQEKNQINNKDFKGKSWTFYPTDDTFISKTAPNINFGSDNLFEVGRYEGYEGEKDALLKFNVSSIPPDTNIFAKLFIYYYKYDGNPLDREYSIYRINNDWDEDTVTWMNQPSYDSTPTDFLMVPDEPGIWLEFDVTKDVRSFIENQFVDFGWIISDDEEHYPNGPRTAFFHSKEYGDFIPYLFVKEPTTIYVDDDNTVGPWNGTQEYPYQYIQDGINNSFLGDTVFVLKGVYEEFIRIYQESINLIGESKEDTMIVGKEKHYVALIGTNCYEITISGFTIKTAADNENGYYGIVLDLYANNNIVSDNMVTDNVMGVVLYGGNEQNYVLNNTINDNGLRGILLKYECVNNSISNNTIDTTEIGIMSQYDSYGNIYDNNFVTNTRTGFYFQEGAREINISKNRLVNNKYGLFVDQHVPELNVTDNFFSRNEIGIVLLIVFYANISNNVIDNNICGIYLQDWGYWEQINVFNNNITNNKGLKMRRGGIIADDVVNGRVYCNNFIGNHPNAKSIGTIFSNIRIWDRNYWDKPRDSPYPIFGKFGFFFIKVVPSVHFDWNPAKEPYDITIDE